MSFEICELLAVKRIDINCVVFGASCHVLIRYEVDAKYRILVVGLHLLNFVEPDLITPSGDASLLIGPHVQHSAGLLGVLAAPEIFGRPLFALPIRWVVRFLRIRWVVHFLRIRWVVDIERPHLGRIGRVQFSEQGFAIFELSPLPLE